MDVKITLQGHLESPTQLFYTLVELKVLQGIVQQRHVYWVRDLGRIRRGCL
jgi:hypothetical protein